MEKVHVGMAGDSLEVESGGVVLVKSGGRLQLLSGSDLQVAEVSLETAIAALANITASAAELSKLKDMPVAATMVTTPATGTCAVQLTLKDADGVQLGHLVAGLLYLSNSAGTAIAGVTSMTTLTNGAIVEIIAGQIDFFITSANGLLGFTLTASTGSYYATLVLPNGAVITTAAIVVN